MDFLNIVALALIQGITEFLPISSSGHLILWPLLTGHKDQGLMMDVAVHMGTLAAVCVYFRAEFLMLLRGLWDCLRGRWSTTDARLFLLIVLATLPAVVAGLALSLAHVMDSLRAVAVIGWTTLLGGILLWWTDRTGAEVRGGGDWGLRDAVIMGLMQAVALIPGTSRSGITMTGARWLGFERAEGARLSLLMAIPVTFAAGLLETAKLVKSGNLAITSELTLGATLSFLAALVTLTVMMRMFRRDWTMLPFVLYRLALGAVLLAIAYG